MDKKLIILFLVYGLGIMMLCGESAFVEKKLSQKNDETLHRKKEKAIEVREEFAYSYNAVIRKGAEIDDKIMAHIRDFAEGTKKTIDGMNAKQLDRDYEKLSKVNQELQKLLGDLKEIGDYFNELFSPKK